MRLDRFLSLRFPDRSRSFFARAIDRGEVRRLDGSALARSSRVRGRQTLRVYIAGIAPTSPPPPFPPIRYIDDTLLVIDKPPGMLCHPSGTRFEWALVSLAKGRYPEDEIDLVHRIDRDTSGLVILTRRRDANRVLKESMKAGDFHKEYEALVRGQVPWSRRMLQFPIGPASGPIRIQMAVREDGLPSTTDVRVLERGPCLTRVQCILHTGRTHQIRVHLAAVGYPLLGDRLYGVSSDVFIRSLEPGGRDAVVEATGAERHALHHRRVRFRHPSSGSWLEIEAPVPRDFQIWWTSRNRE